MELLGGGDLFVDWVEGALVYADFDCFCHKAWKKRLVLDMQIEKQGKWRADEAEGNNDKQDSGECTGSYNDAME